MSLYAADPGRNFHGVVASLPSRLFRSLEELIVIEDRNEFPESIYQQFDSPYSPAFIQFADLRSLMELSAQRAISPETILELEAASFVQFLIEAGGSIDTVKRIWGKGSTDNLLGRIEWVSLDEMGNRWYSCAVHKGKNSPDFDFLSVYYLLAGGFPDSAWMMCSSWDRDSMTQDELAISCVSALRVGKFSHAKSLASKLENDQEKGRIDAFIALYDGWEVRQEGNLRIFTSPAISEASYPELLELEKAFDMVVERLALKPGCLPEKVTLFFYPDAESKGLGKGLFPLLPQDNATLHLTTGDDAQYEMVSIIPVYCWRKDTYSQLLRVGLSVALRSGRDKLISQGITIKSEGRWYPLGSVDFGMAPDEVVKVEAGLMVDYIIENYGGNALREIWIATSPLDEYISLDTALAKFCFTSRQEIEEVLFSRFAAWKDKV
jgi:hypothetical protein